MQAGQVSSLWLTAGPPSRGAATRPGSPRSAVTRLSTLSQRPISASGATTSESWSATTANAVARRSAAGTTRRVERGLSISGKATPPRHRTPVSRGCCRTAGTGLARLPDRTLDREDEPEGAPLPEDRFDPDGAAVQLHELLAERQPEPGSLLLPAGRAVHLAEDLEHPPHVLLPDADPAVAHRDPHRIAGDQPGALAGPLARERQRHRSPERREADGAALGGELG